MRVALGVLVLAAGLGASGCSILLGGSSDSESGAATEDPRGICTAGQLEVTDPPPGRRAVVVHRGGITVRNAGPGCVVAGGPLEVTLSDGDGSVLVRSTAGAGGVWELVRGGHARIGISWRNWCGPERLGVTASILLEDGSVLKVPVGSGTPCRAKGVPTTLAVTPLLPGD